jgi:hypothetical protein
VECTKQCVGASIRVLFLPPGLFESEGRVVSEEVRQERKRVREGPAGDVSLSLSVAYDDMAEKAVLERWMFALTIWGGGEWRTLLHVARIEERR